MTCTVTKRRRAKQCADEVADEMVVEAVDALSPNVDPSDRWTVEVVLVADAGGVPPSVLRILTRNRLTLRTVTPRGDNWVAVATV